MKSLPLIANTFLSSLSLLAGEPLPERPAWSAHIAVTLGDAYWTRPGFFPTHKEGPVIQPEIGVSHLSALGNVSTYAWLNQNLASGLSAEGTHELDLGISYSSPPLVKTDALKAGLSLHGAWWDYGIAGKLGKSHAIIEPGMWMNRIINEGTSLEAKASWVQLLGDKGSDGCMLTTSLAFPYQVSKKTSLTPTLSWIYLTGENFYGSKKGTAHVRVVLPLTYSFDKGYSATLGFRAQEGFNGKDDKLGGFLKLQKDF